MKLPLGNPQAHNLDTARDLRDNVSIVLLMVWGLAIAAVDLRRRRIPNPLLLAALIPAVIGLIWKGHGAFGAGLWQSLAGCAVALGLLLPGYWLGSLGAGDVKYGAIIGLIVGGGLPVLWTMLFAGFALGLIALAAVMTRQQQKNPSFRIPAAVALSVGLWTICVIRMTSV